MLLCRQYICAALFACRARYKRRADNATVVGCVVSRTIPVADSRTTAVEDIVYRRRSCRIQDRCNALRGVSATGIFYQTFPKSAARVGELWSTGGNANLNGNGNLNWNANFNVPVPVPVKVIINDILLTR